MPASRRDRPGRRGATAAARRRRNETGAPSGVTPQPRPPRPVSDAPPSPGAARRSRPFFVWRGWESIATYAVLAVLVVGLVAGSHVVAGVGIIAVGLLGVFWAMIKTNHQFHARLRDARGYGAWLGRLIALAPAFAARLLFVTGCMAITALGVLELVGA
jgi:hypothetical protein